MGHKVHPTGFRIGIIRDWQSRWYIGKKQYVESLHEDLKLRKSIQDKYVDAGVSQIDIERQANKISITIRTSRPGIVIGRGGQRVDETRSLLEQIAGKRVRLNIQEVSQPEMDAYLVARSIAQQMERFSIAVFHIAHVSNNHIRDLLNDRPDSRRLVAGHRTGETSQSHHQDNDGTKCEGESFCRPRYPSHDQTPFQIPKI